LSTGWNVDVASSVAGAPPAARVRGVVSRIRQALRASRVPGPRGKSELSILFCGDVRMRSLNRRFRRRDRSTDVLSFPAGDGVLLGDIVICMPYAARKARGRAGGASREMDRLLLHGYLHLLGYDHETDDGEMDVLEASVSGRLSRRPRP
jgi:probable rRNA maturation factor